MNPKEKKISLLVNWLIWQTCLVCQQQKPVLFKFASLSSEKSAGVCFINCLIVVHVKKKKNSPLENKF